MFGYECRRRSRHCGCAKVGSKVQGRVAETSASWRGNVHCDAWDWRQVPVSRFPAAASQAGCKLRIQHCVCSSSLVSSSSFIVLAAFVTATHDDDRKR